MAEVIKYSSYSPTYHHMRSM